MILRKCDRCGNCIEGEFPRITMDYHRISYARLEELEKAKLNGWSVDLCDSCLSDLQVWLEEKKERKGGQKHDD